MAQPVAAARHRQAVSNRRRMAALEAVSPVTGQLGCVSRCALMHGKQNTYPETDNSVGLVRRWWQMGHAVGSGGRAVIGVGGSGGGGTGSAFACRFSVLYHHSRALNPTKVSSSSRRLHRGFSQRPPGGKVVLAGPPQPGSSWT